MARRRHIILLVVAVLLAGCGQGDNAGDAGVAAGTSSPATVVPAVDSTTTSTPPMATVTTAATTTTTSTTTPTDSEGESINHDPDQVLPGSFGTVGDLISLSGNYFTFTPLDAQISSSMAVEGDEEVLANQGIEAGKTWSLTITYFGETTVWDFGDGYREVTRGDESFYLDEGGAWLENDRWEWPPMGPIYEWTFAQDAASGCLEFGAEVVGLEEVAGATTLHIRCTVDEEGQGGSGFSDVWIGEQGHVMKIIAESWHDPSFGFITVWEVLGLDVEPTGPLPPG